MADGEVINVYKEVGETPLEALRKLKKRRPELKDKSMSYAGKLDPMSEGVLLILTGDKTKQQEKYQSLDKEYIAEVLFGIKTDSSDVLGILEEVESCEISREGTADYVSSLEGEFNLRLPVFSSPTVKGEPLFWWARKEKLDEIDIPKRNMEVYSSVFQKFFILESREVLNSALPRIEKVEGDFRQDDIKKSWRNNLKGLSFGFPVVRFKIQCSSGTYVRSLAEELGSFVGCPSLLFSLVRTKVGLEKEKFWAGDSLRLMSDS